MSKNDSRKSQRTRKSRRQPVTATDSVEEAGSGAADTPATNRRKHTDASAKMSRNNLLMLVFSCVAYALALPPFGIWPLAFVATSGWILFAQQSSSRKDWWWVWGTSCLHWAVTFHFLRLPHWAGIFGLLLIATYAALFDVAFVYATRRLFRRGWSTLIAAPMAWAAVEVLRSTLFTGIPIGILGHSLYRQPLLIQTADLAGEITVSVLLVILAAAAANVFSNLIFKSRAKSNRENGISIVVGISVVALMSVYGWQAINNFKLPSNNDSRYTVGLIQGSRDVQFGLSQEEAVRQSQDSFENHRNLTVKARQEDSNLQVVVWPESMFPAVDVLPIDDRAYQLPEGEQAKRLLPLADALERQQVLPYQVLYATGTGNDAQSPFATSLPIITGIGGYDYFNDFDYNSAVLFDPFGNVSSRYAKAHLVPFGEYLPLGEWFPVLYELAPMSRSLTNGDGAKRFTVGARSFVPTICYESVIGWHVRQYLLELNHVTSEETENVDEPSFDALLNISNDGWFWGSSALDLHLASNVFRSVENRCQHLVSSNTGISCNIAPNGEILSEAAKRKSEFLVAEIPSRPADWKPFWWSVGNWPWWACVCLVIAGSLLPTVKPKI